MPSANEIKDGSLNSQGPWMTIARCRRRHLNGALGSPPARSCGRLRPGRHAQSPDHALSLLFPPPAYRRRSRCRRGRSSKAIRSGHRGPAADALIVRAARRHDRTAPPQHASPYHLLGKSPPFWRRWRIYGVIAYSVEQRTAPAPARASRSRHRPGNATSGSS